jgi:uncharacterized protein YbjT (DUF2867 family)
MAVDAIVGAGCERLVSLSLVGAAPDAVFTLARDHYATEERIRSSGIAFTFLRMTLHIDFIPSMVLPDGTIAGPARDGRTAAVLRNDVADAVAAVLLGNGHPGETFDLTGPEAFTFTEAAELMSRVSGKPIRFHNETIDEAHASRARYGAPEWEVAGWVTTHSGIAAGEQSLVTDSVRVLAGHDPVTLAGYTDERPESLAHVRAPTPGRLSYRGCWHRGQRRSPRPTRARSSRW